MLLIIKSSGVSRTVLPLMLAMSLVLRLSYRMPLIQLLVVHIPSTRSPSSAVSASLHLRRTVRLSRSMSTRSLHSSSNQSSPSAGVALDSTESMPPSTLADPRPVKISQNAPLAVLPLTNVLRSLLTTTISSSPILLRPSLAIMSLLASTAHPVLNPDVNPLLRVFLKKTFYAQFCAGENVAEVRQTIASLKQIGFAGVILGYAKEVVLTDSQMKGLESCISGSVAEECVRNEIGPWAAGTKETVMLASPGDFVALKFTGAGRQALYALSKRLPPPAALASAIDDICELAVSRGIRLLFDAEQQALQPGIDDWSLEYMRKYNTLDRAVIFGTYQAYLKATPTTLSRHLAAASQGGFTLGVKLVRGAYLGSDPRHLIHDTKADTDSAYDSIAEALMKQQWKTPLQPSSSDRTSSPFPNVALVLATHNRESVLKGRTLLSEGGIKTDVAFAQLQGMADEVSCELLTTGNEEANVERPRAYKYLVWGTTGECMKYLLRRAHENRDAVQRTRSGRDAMRTELLRRVKGLFGLGN